MKVLIGGGGWCERPYQSAVEEAVRAFWIKPDIFQLPQPENSQAIWGEEATQLASRFSVAHGLSHPFWEWPMNDTLQIWDPWIFARLGLDR